MRPLLLLPWVLLTGALVGCGPEEPEPARDPATTSTSSTGTVGTTDSSLSSTSSTSTSSTTSTSGTSTAPLRQNWMNPHGADEADLWTNDLDWAQTRAQTDVVSFYVQAVGDDHRGHITAAVQSLAGHGIGVAVEAGGTLASVGCGEDVGALSAVEDLARLETIANAGGQLAYLSLDGPISRTVATGRDGNCGFTVEESAQALAEYLHAVRAVHPTVQIGWLVNVPNWSYGGIAAYQCATKDYGDLEQVLDTVLATLAAEGAGLDYFMVDQPYDYTLGLVDSNCHDDPTLVDWMGRLRDLEDQARSHGLLVAQIYNSSQGGATSNELFHTDTVAYAALHRDAGATPNIRLVSSWYAFPDQALPETEDFTFTHTALATWAAADGGTAATATSP